jgi:hypothetical protein
MAADLISPDDQKLHPQAQAALSQWCPAIRGNETDTYSMRKARAICATRQPL